MSRRRPPASAPRVPRTERRPQNRPPGLTEDGPPAGPGKSEGWRGAQRPRPDKLPLALRPRPLLAPASPRKGCLSSAPRDRAARPHSAPSLPPRRACASPGPKGLGGWAGARPTQSPQAALRAAVGSPQGLDAFLFVCSPSLHGREKAGRGCQQPGLGLEQCGGRSGDETFRR